MTQTITDLNPKQLWNHFNKICGIPRPSGHEQKMIAYIKGFAEGLGLKVMVDPSGNTIVEKPATKGMENRKKVIIQTHLDMVPQNNRSVKHDFLKDPIQPYIDGDWVKARGTTLGADNGIGVAATLAVLESKNMEHGPLCALFTVEEETSLKGAFAITKDQLDGEILLNLDNENENTFCIGCAGGVNTNITVPYKKESIPVAYAAYKLSLTGLNGGHSGLEIHLGRANANKLLNRFLWHASRDFRLRLASIDAGSLRNAIPREAFAVVAVPNEMASNFVAAVSKFEAVFKSEYAITEEGLKFEVIKTDMPESLIDEKTQINLIRAVYACVNGVYRMKADFPGVVETSSNLAVVKSNDKESEIEIITLQRSSVESAKIDIADMVRIVFDMIGANVIHCDDYPGWDPNSKSKITAVMKSLYETMFKKSPEIVADHAGLECGLIGSLYPDMDMISFGPTIQHPHSPDEKVSIPSVAKFWAFFTEVLKNIPVK
ncbi:MAG: aminoacyl-histidine dipeptidase [Deltaproteobacteria bacterium]|nr:aminoacyl-histidine dipeptidase [Deltaproteobacteria bacterium]